MDVDAAEQYLRHHRALRALARTLVADEGAADDLVQDAWLAALRRPPADRRNVRGWLGAVARNAARQVGRAEARRRRREIVAALPERLPAADEVAERAAVHRELVDLVLALEEPSRSALLLRYFEDLPPRAIAAQLDVKVETVHARLLRGRQRLREELDRRYGKRASWRGFFVLALGGPGAFLGPEPPLAWVHGAPAQLAAAGLLAGGLLLGARAALAPGEHVDGLAVAPAMLPDTAAPREPTSAPRAEVAKGAGVDAGLPAVGELESDATQAFAPLGSHEARRPWSDPAPTRAPRKAPPGMVPVEGGRVKVGVSMNDIEDAIVEKPDLGPALVAETPRHEVRVDDFFLMVTEVTNEQFAAFVAATDGRPPYTWSTAAIEEGRKAWFEEDNRKRLEAQEQGHRYTSTEKFEPERWWEQHGKDSAWHVPEEIADHPVTYVAFEDALDYARWAGLRLMSEAEFQCAGRGTRDQDYPWGKRWDPRNAAGSHAGSDEPWPVGSFPDGARNGIFDLIGNVWEWTSSPYTAYPGYMAHEFRTRGKERFTPYAPFDANKRVMVGGSVHMDPIAMRVTVRRGTGRSERTSAAGFRCAASTARGVDLARHALDAELTAFADRLDVERLLLLDRWESEKGSARVRHYAVITAYDHVLFLPARVAGAEGYDMAAADGPPLLLGALVTSVPIAEPPLEPGSYLLEWTRGAIRVRAPGGAELGWAETRMPSSGGDIRVEPGEQLDRLVVRAVLPGGPSEEVVVPLALGLAPGTVEATWSR
jgi:RNA polymerase sigma factor (sigma-70 family)